MREADEDDVTPLLDRVAAGSQTAADVSRLHQLVSVRGHSNRVQVGEHNIDISGGQDIRIGDHVYHGADAATIAAAIRQALGEPPPVPSRIYIAVASLGFLICIAAFAVFGYALFTDTTDLEPGSGAGVPGGVALAGGMFLAGFVIVILASVARAILNPRSLAEQQRRPWR